MNIFNRRGVSTFWGISIILMEVVIVFFVFYILYYFWIENPTPTSNILIVRTFRGGVVNIPNSVETSGWTQETVAKPAVTFKYPGSLTMTEDGITYGTFDGRIVELHDGDTLVFSLRVFPLQTGEQGGEVDLAKVFQRLVGISPSVFQSYPEKVGGHTALVYRQKPGSASGDRIYFSGEGYFFEAGFDQQSANILSTFTFSK